MNSSSRNMLAAVLALALTACAPLASQEGTARTDAQTGAASAEDPAPRFIGLIGRKAQHAPPFLAVPETNFYCLRSFIDRRTGATEHQVYVADSYSGAERRWNAARDGTGRPLRFVEVTRQEITCSGGCSYLEEFAASIPESELRANPQGLTVIFAAASGAEKKIVISGDQIAAQLAAVAKAGRPVRPAAALAPPASPRQSAPPHQ